ncbi:MAG TPA: Co2+/Mg2+ efflux protein ApaG [Gammaproteobacteria bacterium]|nr:Co2+/Mg2+ efflux protein ApaG [Gammaproteobacteria bacterium]
MKRIDTIIVTARPSYIQAQSDPSHQKFMWSYKVTIVNDSNEIVQLLNRYWRITDMTGKIEEIHGAGVVGLQPLIKPGKQFIYTSYCQLVSPQGTMEGHYEVQNVNEEHFRVDIPKFILSAPSSITKLYRSKLH